jgi:multidrug resistance protein, MATE family
VRDSSAHAPLSHRRVLAIAVPVMLSNVSTPLLGVVDTAIIGRLPDPVYIGAVAVGALIFTFAFWAFGFLRMGTTGLTAQALGADDRGEIAAGLARSLLLALAIGAGLILLQWPLRTLAFAAIGASPSVDRLARGYFDVRIWAAPATLANYALLGWFIGLGRTDIGLVLQLILNLTNMALDVLFVLGFGWGVRGVALGTASAEYIAAAAGLMIALRYLGRGGLGSWQHVLAPARVARVFAVNGDIMIRSLALIAVFVWFVAQGARQGNLILAANAILLQFIGVAAYFLDGLAFAAEALVGRALGAARRAELTRAVRLTTVWAAATAALLAVVYASAGPWLIDALTLSLPTRAAARHYLPWAAGAPLLGVWAFQLDGVFIGATRTADMRNAMLLSCLIFLGAWWLLTPFGNAGLWAAFYVHYGARTGTLAWFYPRLLRAVPEAPTAPAAGPQAV